MVLSFKLSKNWAFPSNEHSRILETTTKSAFVSQIHLLNSHWTKSTESHFQPFLNSKQKKSHGFLKESQQVSCWLLDLHWVFPTGLQGSCHGPVNLIVMARKINWFFGIIKYDVIKMYIYMYINWYSMYIYNIQLINYIHIHEVSNTIKYGVLLSWYAKYQCYRLI